MNRTTTKSYGMVEEIKIECCKEELQEVVNEFGSVVVRRTKESEYLFDGESYLIEDAKFILLSVEKIYLHSLDVNDRIYPKVTIRESV